MNPQLKYRKQCITNGISTYKELMELCEIKDNRFSEILIGKKKITEKKLLKISQKLEIPMDFFRRTMKCETKYYIDEYTPIEEEINKFHAKKNRNEKEYQHNYYMRVTKYKRKH